MPRINTCLWLGTDTTRRIAFQVGEEWRGGEGPKHRWRAGGLLLQFLPKAPEQPRRPDLHPGDAPEGAATHTVAEDDAWIEGQSLISTVEDIELIDPGIVGRAAVVPAAARTRRAGASSAALARALFVLARCGGLDAGELRSRRPRRHRQGRQGGRDLRVLLVGL